MSKLLCLLIISFLFIKCTETPDIQNITNIPIQPKEIPTPKIDSSILDYTCILPILEERTSISNKHLRDFFEWYDTLPEKIDRDICKQRIVVEVNSYIVEKKWTDAKMDSHLKYINSLEKYMHMTIGLSDRLPMAKISFSVFPNEISDTSYIKISLNKMVF